MSRDIDKGEIRIGDQLRCHIGDRLTIEGELTGRELVGTQALVVVGGHTFDIRRARRIELLSARPVMADRLDWARPLQRRCRARREPRRHGYFGRCDLRAGHTGLHALERGMETPRWSTDWQPGTLASLR